MRRTRPTTTKARYSQAKPKPPKKPSVPPGLTPAVRTAVVKGVALGVPWHAILGQSGVSSYTVRKWRSKGQELANHFADNGTLPDDVTPDDMDCLRFFDEVEIAHNKAIGLFSKTISRAGKKDWKAAAYWLERRAGELYRTPKTKDDEQKGQVVNNQVALYLPDNGRDKK